MTQTAAWALACVISVCVVMPGVARAQYAGLACTWSQTTDTVTSVPVYFNPGTLAANGFDVAAFRSSLFDAVSVWNEESRSQVDMYYAGDTSDADGIPGAIMINHLNLWSCADNALAKAFGNGSGDCRSSGGTGGALVHVVLRDSCTGLVRPWLTTWPGAAGSGGTSYESVLVHELGHMLGLPDVSTTTGAMNGTYTEHASTLHLYPIDQASVVITASGLTARHPKSMSSTDGVNFTSAFSIGSSSTYSAAGPTLHESTGTHGLRAGVFDQGWMAARPLKGTHGNWPPTNITIPPNGGIGTVSAWVSVARSNTDDEVLAVWPDACTITAHCAIRWAVTNNSGSTWTTGTVAAAATYGRIEAVYDAFRNRFVLAYLDGDTSRIYMTSAVATTAPAWTVPNAASQANVSTTETFRYMGGLVFNSADGTGLLTAATFMQSGTGTPTPRIISQMSTSYTGSTYSLSWSAWANASSPTSYVTRRHFGLARNSAGLVVLAWRGPSATRAFTTATKTSMSTAVAFGVGGERATGAINSVDIAWSPTTNTLVGGLSWF